MRYSKQQAGRDKAKDRLDCTSKKGFFDDPAQQGDGCYFPELQRHNNLGKFVPQELSPREVLAGEQRKTDD
jgi:hypothetical protein